MDQCTHVRFQHALTKINNNLKNRLLILQNKTINININKNMNNIKLIKFDGDSAIKLFLEMFKFTFEWTDSSNLRISISDFNN